MRGDLVGKEGAHFFDRHFLVEAILGEGRGQLRRRRRAEIGRDQRFLQFIEQSPDRASAW